VKAALRWMALVVGFVAVLASSYAAYSLANYSWNQVVDYRGPYTKAPLPPAAPGPRLANRTVFVILDGLREDVSRKMPTLNSLRQQGSDWVVTTGQPSLSHPNWTTLLSGAPQRFSGVTTNWFTTRVPVETLIDTALAASRTVAVSAPSDFEGLYAVDRTKHVFLRDWVEGAYMSGEIVDNAIRLARESTASIVIVHLPDIDEAGHAYGGASTQYAAMAGRVDSDLARLVSSLQSSATAFAVAADHGHIDAGGHGGWEDVVVNVPFVVAGAGVSVTRGTGLQQDVAPTVAYVAGIPVPRDSVGQVLPVAVPPALPTGPYDAQRAYALGTYAGIVLGPSVKGFIPPTDPAVAEAALRASTEARLANEMAQRLPMAEAIVLAALVVVALVGVLSWRALVAALAGTAAYYLLYNGLFFLAHGYQWSLSSTNTEALLKSFMNGRMIEAALSGIFAAAVAADIYLVTRREPKRPKGDYLPGWLSLGVATVLVIQATLWIQVAWYLWTWGASVTWFIPDLKWGFKYDLDLLQLTALVAAAALAPVVTYLVGRYHPLRRTVPEAPQEGEAG
jgi:hypothetical protein